MSKDRTSKDYIFLIIKGLAMGTANKVPGVSGGVVAFATGFYEEFIYSLQKFNRKALNLLLKGRYRSFFRYINFKFLSSIVLGMLISYFSVSRLLDYFMGKSELLVWALFFGMILGSLNHVFRDFQGWMLNAYIACFFGLLVGLGISFLKPVEENTNLFFVFFCGVISVSGMTLPGLSGSFILLLIGNYELLLIDSVNILYNSISHMFLGDFSFLQDKQQLEILTILGVFTLGSMVGMIAFSQLLAFLLKRFHDITTAVIIGFIAGSLGVVWPWKRVVSSGYERYIPDFSETQTWLAILFVGVGVGVILLLEYYGKKQKV